MVDGRDTLAPKIHKEFCDVNDAEVSGRLMSLAQQEDGSFIGRLVPSPDSDTGRGVFALSGMPLRLSPELAQQAQKLIERGPIEVRGYLENSSYTLSLAQALEWWGCDDVLARFWPERAKEAEHVVVHTSEDLLVSTQVSSAGRNSSGNWAQIGGVIAAVRIIEGAYTEVRLAVYDEHAEMGGQGKNGLPLRKAHYVVVLLRPGTESARLGLQEKVRLRISGRLVERRPEQTLLSVLRWLGLQEWESAYPPETLAAVNIPMTKAQVLAEAVVLPSREQRSERR